MKIQYFFEKVTFLSYNVKIDKICQSALGHIKETFILINHLDSFTIKKIPDNT